jgi:DGQHR domain-containing protein
MPETLLERRALEILQGANRIYLFTLAGHEIFQIADISRVSRSDAGALIGYQRDEVRQHVDEIVDYLETPDPLFANSIIIALGSDVRFRRSRGPAVSDGYASAGTLEIPIPPNGGHKPAWIVDGQQRAYALARSARSELPVPVTAFIADSVDVQRDQFLRINNTKPLPRGLVTELLPEVSTPLPPRLAARKLPSALVDLLNQDEASPFYRLVKRASSSSTEGRRAAVTDTSLVRAIEESLNSTAGCLFPYRNLATGETDIDAVWRVLMAYWTAVRNTFPDAWGLPPSRSRLMHGVGIRGMGRLMDRVMYSQDPAAPGATYAIEAELAVVADHCRWTAGTWDESGLRWNELQNVPKHISWLSNYLIRIYLQGRTAAS